MTKNLTILALLILFNKIELATTENTCVDKLIATLLIPVDYLPETVRGPVKTVLSTISMTCSDDSKQEYLKCVATQMDKVLLIISTGTSGYANIFITPFKAIVHTVIEAIPYC